MRALVQAVEAGDAVLDGCARRRRLLATPLVEVDLWRCVRDGAGLRAERSHALPVLTVLLSGASVLHEGGRSVVMETGTALLTDAGVTYRSGHPFGCGDMGCHVRPSAALLDAIPVPRAPWLARAMSPAAHLSFRRALTGALAPADALELEEQCVALLRSTSDARPSAREPKNARHRTLVEDAKACLLHRLGERLSLPDVARAVGASPFHLARVFRAHTGFSLHGYRTRMRLIHALDRLADARRDLTGLALDLGFSSQSHFTDAFRSVYGVPPGAVASHSEATRRNSS